MEFLFGGKGRCFRTGLTIDRWGPSAWNTLHAFAHRSRLRLDDAEQQRWRTFLFTFAELLPCPRCRDHFRSYLQAHATDETFLSRESIVAFLNDAHNAVNVRLGRPEWSLAAHYAAYSRPPPTKPVEDTLLFGSYLMGAVVVVVILLRNRRLIKKSLRISNV